MPLTIIGMKINDFTRSSTMLGGFTGEEKKDFSCRETQVSMSP